MDKFIKAQIEKFKMEIRDCALNMHQSGYDIKIRMRSLEGYKYIYVLVNGNEIFMSFEKGVFGSLFEIRNILYTLCKFVRDVA